MGLLCDVSNNPAFLNALEKSTPLFCPSTTMCPVYHNPLPLNSRCTLHAEPHTAWWYFRAPDCALAVVNQNGLGVTNTL
jgi:hypothetical protein